MDDRVSNELLTAAGPGRQPLYASLAGVLSRDIHEGKYSTGSILPSEKELTERYGVSRQTVRQALRLVREEGLISSHPGIGTTVRAPARRAMFSAVNSIEDLLNFVGATEMHAVSLSEVTVTGELARRLECKEGLVLSEACFVRRVPGSDIPMSYVLIYVQPRFAAAQVTPPVSNTPIYKNIERMFGVRVNEVRQDISAVNLDARLAEVLQAREGDAALLVTRFYYDVNGTLIQSSISYYPGDRYTQSARFRATNGMT